MSCAGNGYLSGNMLVPFPFEDGKVMDWCDDTVRSNEVQLAFQRCIVDAAVHISDHSIPAGGWPELSVNIISIDTSRLSVSIHACGYDADIEIAAGAERFPIYSADAEWGSYILIASSEGIRDFVAFCRKNNISPPAPGSSSPSGRDGVYSIGLCDRCVTVRPRQLESIRVLDGMNPPVFSRVKRSYEEGDVCWHNGFHRCVNAVSEGSRWMAADWEEISVPEVNPSFSAAGNISVKPGNNMLLTQQDDGDGIAFNAVPGAGLGVINCGCSGRAERVNPIFSPDGQTRLFNDTCYDLEPTRFWTRTVDGEKRPARDFQIHVKCTSCCPLCR